MTKCKLPPYGAALAARIAHNNPPFLARVCVGADAWRAAKRINTIGDSAAIVIPPGHNPAQYDFAAVRGQIVVIDWSAGPAREYVSELARVIAAHGPQALVMYPSFVDPATPLSDYDESRPVGDRWVDIRDSVRVFGLVAT